MYCDLWPDHLYPTLTGVLNVKTWQINILVISYRMSRPHSQSMRSRWIVWWGWKLSYITIRSDLPSHQIFTQLTVYGTIYKKALTALRSWCWKAYNSVLYNRNQHGRGFCHSFLKKVFKWVIDKPRTTLYLIRAKKRAILTKYLLL